MNIVEAENISKTYTIDNRKVSVLKNISLAVNSLKVDIGTLSTDSRVI